MPNNSKILWDFKNHSSKWWNSPVIYEGAWFRIVSKLYINSIDGYSTNIKEWASITGLTIECTKEFIEHLIKNNLALVTKLEESNSISITCTKMYKENRKRELTKLRLEKFRNKPKKAKTPTEKRRRKLLIELQKNYHPSRSKSQIKEQYKLYENILKKSSSTTRRSNEKEQLEQNEHNIVLKYIKSLKNTKEWTTDNGKFLPGLGKILGEKRWISTNKKSRYNSYDNEERELAKLLGEI